MEQERLSIAISAVKRACELTRLVQENLVTEDTLTKKDKSPVTVADFGAQALIAHEIRAAFPEDFIVSEEDTAAFNENPQLSERVKEAVTQVAPEIKGDDVVALIDHGKVSSDSLPNAYWTIDPVDGTKGFLRKQQYALALAFIVDGVVEIGVLGCPNLSEQKGISQVGSGCVLWASKGNGAFQQSLIGETSAQKIGVESFGAELSHAKFCESVESSHSSHDDTAKIADALGVKSEPFRIDSQCKYAVVARGDAQIYLRMPTSAEYRENIWDHAAGVCIVQESGGTVTDANGEKLNFNTGTKLQNNRGIIATGSVDHTRVISAVREVCGRV